MHMGIRRGLIYQWSVDPDFGGGGHNSCVWLGRYMYMYVHSVARQQKKFVMHGLKGMVFILVYQ